jgi:putative flippase GtrA
LASSSFRPPPWALARQAARFLAGAGVGVAVDLGLFLVLAHLGVPAGLANVVSAGTSVVVVYVIVTRYAFEQRRSGRTFLLFVGWYVVSILVFSFLIELLHGATGWAPFVCKLVSLLPSFAANFLASRLLFRGGPALAPLSTGPVLVGRASDG